MFTCDVCGGHESHHDTVSEIFEIDGRRVLVENIPVEVCMHCGEMSFTADTAERVRRMIHGEAEPVGVVELELFDFA
jgi:HTH-type transcriptional regulator / antitoxin MqsA